MCCDSGAGSKELIVMLLSTQSQMQATMCLLQAQCTAELNASRNTYLQRLALISAPVLGMRQHTVL